MCHCTTYMNVCVYIFLFCGWIYFFSVSLVCFFVVCVFCLFVVLFVCLNVNLFCGFMFFVVVLFCFCLFVFCWGGGCHCSYNQLMYSIAM